ncbi:FtsX-like permease family protein [Fervidibacillus albus]|uniref:ABC3 transporter permease C-terminal domain-containing protein n=1 Tax=Fervidibacillus albus TaxID=2980026 RepID=A0A9E8LTJ1_9BACI|nr:FtsX-like permease family protein [Fervidibacillus albus]WAA09262.1 hypothetical protein OE104_11900 [Fervidibacillus albus]
MYRLLFKNFLYYWRSTLSVFLILILIGLTMIYAFQTVEKMQMKAMTDLTDQWRTGYDLLVSPAKLDDAQYVEPIQHGLEASEVLGNHFVRRSDMSHYGGGISIEQYEQIQSIEGVQVAAPLSFIGYIENEGLSLDFNIDEYGFYMRQTSVQVFDGIRYRDITYEHNKDGFIYQYIDEKTMNNIVDILPQIVEEGGWIPTSVGINPVLRTDGSAWSFAAIDPEQEAQLLNMDKAIVQGEYFSLDENLATNNGVPVIPLILLNQPYDVIFHTTVYKIDVPENADYKQIMDLGGAEYLRTLPKEKQVELTFNPYGEDYLYEFGHIRYEDGQLTESESHFSYQDEWAMIEYSPLQFKSVSTTLSDNIPVVEALPQGTRGEQINYRNARSASLNKTFGLEVIGQFDANLLTYQFTTSESPLMPDYYKPENVYITHDVEQKSYDEPFIYQNSPYKNNYYTGGIDAITTLQAAEYILGEEPISIIRVIVEGAGKRSPESMAKVEKVAEEIRKKTGLQVDIMLGAADRKVHVLLNDFESIHGYGYLLEGWSQEGMSFAIEERVNTTNLILSSFIILMGFIGLSLVYKNYTNNRKRDMQIQYIFGWTKKKIVLLLVFESLTLLLLIILSLIITVSLGSFNMNQVSFIASIWVVGSIAVITLLYILPIIRSLNTHSSRVNIGRSKRLFLSQRPAKTLLSISIRQMMRHPTRTMTKMLIVICTLLYVTFFITTMEHSSSILFLTFLGERIDTSLSSFQWILFTAGILLALFSYFAILLNQMESRQKDIQIYQAWGWERKKWTIWYLFEEVLIGIGGIIFGTLFSYILLKMVVTNVTWNVTLVGIVNLSILIITVIMSLISLTIRSRNISLREFH